MLGYSVFFNLKRYTPMNIDYDSLFCFVDDFCKGLCAGHGKEVEDESSLQADLKWSASLDKVILVRG